ncbi:MAG: disulfide bond formation protein DsbA [Micrococcales bacterium]|nr:MAG: disulfide bond formation protein DsbA [Micrococcales bacterium]
MTRQTAPQEAGAFQEVTVFVDPVCPFAWITQQWLAEVSHRAGVRVAVELMSLSAVNEGREADERYRELLAKAWRPVRVAAALCASSHSDRWPDLYEQMGRYRHVEGMRDEGEIIEGSLCALGLPAGLAAAADEDRWDDDLRRRTAVAQAPVGDDAGTPILHIGERGFFGPVLTAIPRGVEAVELWGAVSALVKHRAFSEIKGPRAQDLKTS